MTPALPLPRRKAAAMLVVVTLAAVAVSCPAILRAKEGSPRTALDDYVEAADDSYEWKVVREKETPDLKTVVIDMVSQTWRDRDDVDRPVWRHWLVVTSPKQRKTNVGLLLIGGGRNGSGPPEEASDMVRKIAQATGAVVAELRMVPNQPLVFQGDDQGRTEDDLIAYTWEKFLETGDPTWPARNPMVKSAVRAMDTITALTKREDAAGPAVDQFVVAGGSKRGWTTWLTGAVDPRVVAIVPIVIDVLNVEASMRHHFAAYGFWAPSIGDYIQHQIPQRRDHPRMRELYELVDPYYYRHRLTMPKFIVNAAGDQFFPPDSSQFYFAELQGEKALRYVPNADHSLDGTDAVESVAAFFALILAKQPVPQISWEHHGDGTLAVSTEDRPVEVRLWQATNPDERDFRMETFGPRYTSRQLADEGGGRYVSRVAPPERGWTAYFAEATFQVGDRLRLKITTDVRVTPDRLPFVDKDPNLPTTVTLLCQAPSAGVDAELRKLLAEQTFPGIEGPLRIGAAPRFVGNGNAGGNGDAGGNGSSNSHDAVPLRLNWTPRGNLEVGGEAVTQWLRERKCTSFAYRLESGPWDESLLAVPRSDIPAAAAP
jgi:PhoPQ-activated pathogenicity-related protein